MVFHDLLFVSDDALAQLRAGNQPRGRAGGDDAVFKPDGLFAARVQLHVQRARVGECRPAFVFVNLVLLHQVAHALDAAVGHLAASAERLAVIETDASFDINAERLGFVFEDVNQLRVAEQRLGWNATDIEADAAPILFLDDGCLQPELFGADGRNVTSRPCAQHDNIVIFCHKINLWYLPELLRGWMRRATEIPTFPAFQFRRMQSSSSPILVRFRLLSSAMVRTKSGGDSAII